MGDDIDNAEAPVPEMVGFGGFWRRLAAFVVDVFIILLLLIPIPIFFPSVNFIFPWALLFLLCFYCPLFESSSLQATLGKRGFGMRVVDADGGRITFRRATIRYCAKLLYFVLLAPVFFDLNSPLGDFWHLYLLISFALALCIIPFSRKKRGLHDFVAKTHILSRPLSKREDLSLCIVLVLVVFSSSDLTYPPITREVLRANCVAVAKKGKNVHAAIIATHATRQGKMYTTSTDYFNDLLQATSAIDCSKFAGSGVYPSETGVLTANNNMWSVLINATDSDSDQLPMLITRNVDVEALNQALKAGITSKDFSTRMKVSEQYRPPFSTQAYVLVRKNGNTFIASGRHLTLGAIFGNTEIPARPESEPPLMYLQP